jgi:hypothetical protein
MSMTWPSNLNKPLHWLLVAVVFCGILATVVLTKHNYSGDEPHYLVMTYSIVKDHDLDLCNDYTTERYHSYYPLHLDPHLSSGNQPVGYSHCYSIHGAGLPLMLALPVAFFGIRGAVATMGLVGLLTLALLYLWTKRVTGRRLAAWAAVAVLGTSVFFTGLVGYIYPDLPIAALFLAALLLVSMKANRWWRWSLLGLVLGAATWFHFKTLLTFSPLGLLGLYAIWRLPQTTKRKLFLSACLIIPWLALNLLFEFKMHQWFNVWIPSQIYPPSAQLLQVSPLVVIPAMLFDASKGLLNNNPAFWLLLVGLPLWYKLSRQTFWIALLAVLPTIIVQATFSDWTGGYAPSGRYILEFLPALLPAIGFIAVLSGRTLLKLGAGLLVTCQLWFSVMLVRIQAPIFDITQRSPLATEIQKHTKVVYDSYWPHYELIRLRNHADLPLVWLDTALAMSLFGLGVLLAQNRKQTGKVIS